MAKKNRFQIKGKQINNTEGTNMEQEINQDIGINESTEIAETTEGTIDPVNESTQIIETVTTVEDETSLHNKEEAEDIKEEVKLEQAKTVAEIKPEVKSTEKAKIEDTQSIKPDVFDAKIIALKEGGTPVQKSIIAGLELYIENMKPGKPIRDNLTGARYQYNLWKLIQDVIQNNQAEFKKNWNLILAYFDKHKAGVFHDRYVYRYSEYWSWNEEDAKAFQQIVHLIKVTANQSEKAKGLKSINLEAAVSKGLTEEGRQRLINFYKI